MTDIEAAFVEFNESGTLNAAQRLEVLLDESYPEDALVQECVEALACYRPEGGNLLLDQAMITPIMSRLGDHLGLPTSRG